MYFTKYDVSRSRIAEACSPSSCRRRDPCALCTLLRHGAVSPNNVPAKIEKRRACFASAVSVLSCQRVQKNLRQIGPRAGTSRGRTCFPYPPFGGEKRGYSTAPGRLVHMYTHVFCPLLWKYWVGMKPAADFHRRLSPSCERRDRCPWEGNSLGVNHTNTCYFWC